MAQVPSTNVLMAERARAGEAAMSVLVADHQTAGRGRRDRSWETPSGHALLMSVLLRLTGGALSNPHRLTQAMGLAACRATRDLGVPATLKWPNDLLVGNAKLAGILAEAVPTTDGGMAVVVGIGMNVLSGPPTAAWVQQHSSRRVEVSEMVELVLGHLHTRLQRPEMIDREYQEVCSTIGRRIRVETAAGWEEGRATGVDHDGLLLWVDSKGRPGALSAGDVVHLRPGDGAW